ncbi:MAG TPA: dynamin family protein [Ruminiclostridium sp.]|nr:dynamin family protein [Ruminiclostridium sp.]
MLSENTPGQLPGSSVKPGARKILKTDFFTHRASQESSTMHASASNKESAKVKYACSTEKATRKVHINSKLGALLEDTQKLANELKMNFLTQELNSIYSGQTNQCFTISVVGEFSRGKSTLINNLFNAEILPTGALPTTAIQSKITYNEKPMIVHILPDGSRQAFELKQESWDTMIVKSNGKRPEGIAYVGIDDQWLRENNVQIIDTPGICDLSETSELLVNDAITCSDGVIIAVSALMAMSLTEKSFIEDRIVAKKVPHMMLVITRLDQVPDGERKSVVELVRDKLAQWGVELPVYISQSGLPIPDFDDSGISGPENIKKQIITWITDSGHQQLKLMSACTQLETVFSIMEENLSERKKLLAIDENKKREIVKKEQEHLDKMKIQWESLRLEMLSRSNICTRWIEKSISEKQQQLLERILYELEHVNNPKVWWDKDYPYRMKIEMTAIAAAMENGLEQIFAGDIRWLNDSMMKSFSTNVMLKRTPITDKESFSTGEQEDSQVQDFTRYRLMTRIGTGAATICCYMLAPFLGPIGIIASITGGITSEILINKNMAKQKEKLKVLVEKDVAAIIENALTVTINRVQSLYDKAIDEASAQERLWLAGQQEKHRKVLEEDKRNEELEQYLKRISKLNERKNALTA